MNKAETYKKMVAYLQDLGADMAGHDQAAMARTSAITLSAMDAADLLHYQRVLEATIDNPSHLMDREAMKTELTEIVRERLVRGDIVNKPVEVREFNARLAALSVRKLAINPMLDSKGHIYEADGRDVDSLCGIDYQGDHPEDEMIMVGARYDDPRGALGPIKAVAGKHGIQVCPDCVAALKEYE